MSLKARITEDMKNAMRAKFDRIMVPIADELIAADQRRPSFEVISTKCPCGTRSSSGTSPSGQPRPSWAARGSPVKGSQGGSLGAQHAGSQTDGERARGNQTRASEILGLNRGTLRKKLKDHGLM